MRDESPVEGTKPFLDGLSYGAPLPPLSPRMTLPHVSRQIPDTPFPTFVVEDAREAARAIAAEVAALIRESANPVLGLATGHTPISTYEELVALHRERGLSFAGVTTFNLDEYVGLPDGHPASFRAFMERHLFDAVDLDPTRTFFPRPASSGEETVQNGTAYEQAIREADGIDLQLLGLGRNGHVAFNEPGSTRDSRTRVVELSESTRGANARDFPEGEEVPRAAMTMGIATILEARRLRVLAFGAHKSEVVARLLTDEIGPGVPATFLREHPDVELWIDPAAAGELGIRR